MKILEDFVVNYQLGSMTSQDMKIFLGRQAGLHPKDRRKALELVKALGVGIRFIHKLRADRNGNFSKRIPEEIEWRRLVILSSKEQAEWYKGNCPEVGTPEYNMFKRLCKAFGVGGNEFYYWLRKLS